MDYAAEIQKALTEARAQVNQKRAVEAYNQALKLSEEWAGASAEPRSIIQTAQILSELAYEQNVPAQREACWTKAFAALRRTMNRFPGTAEMWARLAVDSYQDGYSGESRAKCIERLRQAEGFIDQAMPPPKSADGDAAAGAGVRSSLLAAKSSVLRWLATTEIGRTARIRRLEEAIRCAALAKRLSGSPAATLELGLSKWELAKYDTSLSDRDHGKLLAEAEALLVEQGVDGSEVGKLTLARFYRANYRSLDACIVFQSAVEHVTNVRRMLRSVSVYAEAAQHLWYINFPSETVVPHLEESQELLSRAIAGGFSDARTIINLAFVTAMLDDRQSANVAMQQLLTADDQIDWTQAIDVATKADSRDPLSQGFAIGMNSCAAIYRVGTFAKVFLDMKPLAERLYRAAVRLDKHNPIALTNLARMLAEEGTGESLREAERLLQQAGQFSDRRFIWWKALLGDVRTRLNSNRPVTVHQHDRPKSQTGAANVKDIRKRFLALEVATDVHQRGRDLERLVHDLAKLTFAFANPSYVNRIDGEINQIDSYFQHRGDRYRVECKWKAEPADQDDVVLFENRLDVAGLFGVLISMSGFKDTAVAKARHLRSDRPILLVDGEEARRLFNGHTTFDQLIDFKQHHLNMRANPYARMTDPGSGVSE